MRVSRMAAMAAAAVFVVGCSEQKGVTDVRQAKSELVSLAGTGGGGSAASFTTIAFDGACLNGSGLAAETVNCNLYKTREDVYLNGGPTGANLDPGTYFWVVLTPSGQNKDLEDGSDLNLSDPTFGDSKANRTFTIDGEGNFEYVGSGAVGEDPHAKIPGTSLVQLYPFDKTGNNGGVYTVAICALVDGKTGKCKFDNFRIQGDGTVTNDEVLADPVPTKTADGVYTRTYAWSIAKTADRTLVSQTTGNVTFNYAVAVAQTGVAASGWTVTGVISVTNPNEDPIVVSVVDKIGDTMCTITDDAENVLTDVSKTSLAGETETAFNYTCILPTAPPELAAVTNTVTVNWDEQSFDGTPTRVLKAGTATFTYDNVPFVVTEKNQTVNVTDSFTGALGVLVGTTAEPFASTTYRYTRTVQVISNVCTAYPNIATITETAQTSSQSVTVCGPATSGLTIGFWQNKNGQDAIKGGPATAGVCNLTGYLRGLGPINPATVGNAFSDLAASASCSTVATYVTNIIKAASAAGDAMNPMLRAQYLATALSVYHSRDDVKRIPGPSLGGIKIDLTKVCLLSSADCSATQNVSAAFGGATALTVSDMLTYAGKQATTARGAMWYANVKAMQELAKNAFDVINNKKAFVAP